MEDSLANLPESAVSVICEVAAIRMTQRRCDTLAPYALACLASARKLVEQMSSETYLEVVPMTVFGGWSQGNLKP